jgi:Arc/MetJ family transcription regulator
VSARVFAPGKTRITIRIDDDVLAWFRKRARTTGGYQSLINRELRADMAREPLEATLRRVVREEFARAEGWSSQHTYRDGPTRTAWVAEADGHESVYGASLKRQKRRGRRGAK